MRKLDYFWKSNPEWWYRKENGVPWIREDAPKEAQESWKRYREQKKRPIA